MKKSLLLSSFLLVASFVAVAQQKTTIKEYQKVFTTYPFSDPDPIPVAGKIYPYFRFDGYTNTSVQQSWKVVELENDYIKVMILPEIGGKIWTAIEKSTGQPFLYYNHVVKFRDVSLRGPWTNGGIESNYGIQGHTPNVATPVDYMMINRPDGSVSCVIGVLDLLTRSTWRLDINLEKDKAYFTTNSFWYNGSPIEQPYYHWMNAGIKSDGNLQFVNTGSRYLGHQGEYSSWPRNEEKEKDISFYNNNDFGGYKSYHVFGKQSDFYGGFWHDDNFGMGRYAAHADKAGKKVWLWGLSGQGMMWEKLLTDTDGQEVEVQSGRLFNQASHGSSYTPFKNRGFAPHAADTWSEYWFPVVKTNGLVIANNYGALNIKEDNGRLNLYFSPLQPVHDSLIVSDGDNIIYSKLLNLKTLELFTDAVAVKTKGRSYSVKLGGNKLTYDTDTSVATLGRPVDLPADFDWSSASGLYTLGKEDIRTRSYASAEKKLRECLEKDHYYTPALVDLSMLCYRSRQYDEALSLSRKALSLNTYDPGANYYYGIINNEMGNITDAKDGLDIAAMSAEYRSPAYTALSEIYLGQKEYNKAIEYANKSIDYNKYAVNAYQVLALTYRLQNNKPEAGKALDTLLAFDPINHFAAYEKYRWNPSATTKDHFTGMIRNEMPHETYLEMAAWYVSVGQQEEAVNILALSPANTEVYYWLSNLQQTPLDNAKLQPGLVFPFRPETAKVLEKLIKSNDHWLLKYHLALIAWHLNDTAIVKNLFTQCGQAPDYAPFYAARARLFKNDTLHQPDELEDILHAAALDPASWRYGSELINYYIHHRENEKALNVAEKYHRQFPGNYLIGMLYSKALLINKKYSGSQAVLKQINILPNEGATSGRELYKETQLMLALEQMNKKKFTKALSYIAASREWPSNLGVGKPYDRDIDERMENWFAYESYQALGNKAAAGQALQKIISFDLEKNDEGPIAPSINHLVTAWAFQKSGDADKGEKLLSAWLSKNPRDIIAQWALNTYKGTAPPQVNPLLAGENFRIVKALVDSYTSK